MEHRVPWNEVDTWTYTGTHLPVSKRPGQKERGLRGEIEEFDEKGNMKGGLAVFRTSAYVPSPDSQLPPHERSGAGFEVEPLRAAEYEGDGGIRGDEGTRAGSFSNKADQFSLLLVFFQFVRARHAPHRTSTAVVVVEHVRLEQEIKIKGCKVVYLDYQSKVDWRSARDILRCNPQFHNAPRYDSVIYESDDDPLAMGQLQFMFRALLPSGAELDLAMIRPFRKTAPNPHRLPSSGAAFSAIVVFHCTGTCSTGGFAMPNRWWKTRHALYY
ncbi:hypothetical protein DFH06DRAFT_1289864 [Mycena polygramma]|nr:hypothetical protein DFH06DRAFT_1289864 [Mycena polygramma]